MPNAKKVQIFDHEDSPAYPPHSYSTRAMPRAETSAKVEPPRPNHFEAEIKRLQAEAIAAKALAASAEQATRELRESIEQQERSRKVLFVVSLLLFFLLTLM